MSAVANNKLLVIRSSSYGTHFLRAYLSGELLHEYEGPDRLKVAWQFETDNPVFRDARVIDLGDWKDEQ